MHFFFGLSLGPPAFASALPRQASGPRLRPQKSTFYRALFYAWCFGSSGTEHLFLIKNRVRSFLNSVFSNFQEVMLTFHSENFIANHLIVLIYLFVSGSRKVQNSGGASAIRP